jgi:uncharacterized protein (TIGR00251 family)
MIPYTEKNGTLVFRVLASPRSRTEIVGEYDGALRVRLKASPVGGAANEELIRILAKTFNVPRTAVEIVSGHSSKRKSVSIGGTTKDLVPTLVRLAMPKS